MQFDAHFGDEVKRVEVIPAMWADSWQVLINDRHAFFIRKVDGDWQGVFSPKHDFTMDDVQIIGEMIDTNCTNEDEFDEFDE